MKQKTQAQETLARRVDQLTKAMEDVATLKALIAEVKQEIKDEKQAARNAHTAARYARIQARQDKLAAQESKRADVILRAQERLARLIAKTKTTPVGTAALKANRKPSKMTIVQVNG